MSTTLAFLGNLGGWEILVIILIIVLLFGSTKIPQLMRGVGSGINEFKKGLKEGEAEAKAEEAKADAAKAEAKPAEAKPAEAKPPAPPESK
jgi:sec-independent protein translocase protein TatA